ncbi:MAG: transposase [Thermodesulfobacteriota bacterium]
MQQEIMARLSRIVVPGHPHHVTRRGVRSMNVFHEESDRREYLAMLGEEIGRHGVPVLVSCLLTNHVHFLAVPHREDSLAKCFGRAHRRYTRMKSFAARGRGYLFQGRFSSCVLDEGDLLGAVRYVEQNPVRAGMANVPWDYPWSSARFHMGTTVHDPLVTDRALLGLVQDWERLLPSSDEGRFSSLRKGTRTGRPAKDAAFVARVQTITGPDLSKEKPEDRARGNLIRNKLYVPSYRYQQISHKGVRALQTRGGASKNG